MKILAVCLSQPQTLPGKSYRTGIFKSARTGPVMVDEHGLVGDAVLNRKYHGGPDQAIYLEGALTLQWWEAQLNRQITPGLFGENLVIDGLDNRDLAVGDRLSIGDVLLEVTAPRTPCATFSARMEDSGFVKRYTKAARPGAYCRVLQSGLVEAGMIAEWAASEGDRLMLAQMIGKSFKSLDPQQRARYLTFPIAARIRAEITATP
ncbi:MOSC domain-containing protein [Agrobacterium vitis]|uniref:MOSC domain-containing protein n=1 Tax=Agrobacterium vitis TaxID=373 RepID=A0A368NWR0_AGRVI|nr:MOSC domain-containing protein [Agrobacterium vitis]KAA3514738.1 MOSC domain-containing protein [Agrobacterium vitis]KAA3528466.1 MOSC domain-containing protein [Agrobacterium vitis]MCF1477928.1 MOSC domain-containing protein [Agrobacterium vitis]MUZ98172.1 MOSC domain-containing protein [Agrobacterium vitis]MVA31627.1 MOSC domain-containing protein [Agrobacterium vitis]